MPDRSFDFTIQPYSGPIEVEIHENCNAIMVVNIAAVGGPLATVNRFPINPPLAAGSNGESFIMGGNAGEIINRKSLDIGFPAGAVGASVIVVQKYYVIKG